MSTYKIAVFSNCWQVRRPNKAEHLCSVENVRPGEKVNIPKVVLHRRKQHWNMWKSFQVFVLHDCVNGTVCYHAAFTNFTAEFVWGWLMPIFLHIEISDSRFQLWRASSSFRAWLYANKFEISVSENVCQFNGVELLNRYIEERYTDGFIAIPLQAHINKLE